MFFVVVEISFFKDVKVEKIGKKKVSVGKGKIVDFYKEKDVDFKKVSIDEKDLEKDFKIFVKNIENNDEAKNIEKNDEVKNIEKEEEVGNSSVFVSVKFVKKKIVRRIVK